MASVKMRKSLRFLESKRPGGVYHTAAWSSIIIIFMIKIGTLTSPIVHDTIAADCQGKFYREIRIRQQQAKHARNHSRCYQAVERSDR